MERMVISRAKNKIKQKRYLDEIISSTIFLALSLIFLYLQSLYVQISAYLVSFILFLILGISGYVNIITNIIKNKHHRYTPSTYKDSDDSTIDDNFTLHHYHQQHNISLESVKPKDVLKCPLCYTEYPRDTIHTRCIHCHSLLPRNKD